MPAPATSVVSQRVTNADGSPFIGLINIQPMAMQSGDVVVRSAPVRAASLGFGFQDISYIILDGLLNVAIAQNSTASPAGTSYHVTYTPAPSVPGQGFAYDEYWVVPAGGPYTIAQVLVASPPVTGITVGVTQISGAGFTSGQVIEWNGTAFGPGSGGGGGATIAHTGNLIKGDGAGNGIDSGIAAVAVAQLALTQAFTTDGTPGNFTLANSAIRVMNGSTEVLRIWATDPNPSDYNSQNLYIGQEAGLGQPTDNSSAAYLNIGIGTHALAGISTGSHNTALGNNAALATTSGYSNVAIGDNSLTGTQDGAENVGIGFSSLLQCISGSDNVAIGKSAGDGTTNGSNNTYLGAGTFTVGDFSDSTAIGANAGVTASHQVVIGANSVTETILHGYLKSPIQSSPAVAPGAGFACTRWEPGTNPGTAKLVAYSGTSATGVVITDNVGAGN